MFNREEDAGILLAVLLNNERGDYLPKSIRPHNTHKLLPLNALKRSMSSRDPRIREKHIQPSIPLHSLVHNALHGGFIRCVESPHVHVCVRVERFQLPRVRR